jgi:hypothetical protein
VSSDGSAFEPRQRVFEQALDRLTGRLTLPTHEPRSIVGQGDLQGAHIYRNGLTPFLASTGTPGGRAIEHYPSEAEPACLSV